MFYKAEKLRFKVEHFIEELEGSILGGRRRAIHSESITENLEYIVSVTGMSLIFTFSLSFASLCAFALQRCNTPKCMVLDKTYSGD